MGTSNEYKTKQREVILHYLQNHGENHVTIDEVLNHLREQNISIGRTTIYRYMEKLTESGVLRKYFLEEGMGACYQFIGEGKECHSHFHLKCVNCGVLLHVQCKYLAGADQHILEEHGFEIDNTKTVFYGLCKDCKEKKGV
ncbi:Fur family transcriptional regulator [Anaerosporobacter faecicola]|uniref:Fur family transcriptional regulator n=1 Tax=Anaerosporobacter faecicola TaxID=2718714 RepID=UPI00143997C8|nr:Fur family transcriptional regulator [Anaerosporobacter faecicola]